MKTSSVVAIQQRFICDDEHSDPGRVMRRKRTSKETVS
jgi:hypothetical protein